MAELAYIALRRRIVEHRIAPGERLDVDEIGTVLGCSRAPVVDALKLLAADGLVVSRRRVGTFASPILPARIQEVFEARDMLEQWSVPAIVDNVGNRQIAALERDIEEASALLAVGGESEFDYPRFMEIDQAFHAAIIRLAERELFTRWFDGLNAHMQRVRHAFQGEALARSREGQLEHMAILEAIRRRDVAGTRAALSRHTLRSRTNALEIVQARFEAPVE